MTTVAAAEDVYSEINQVLLLKILISGENCFHKTKTILQHVFTFEIEMCK